MSFPNLIGATSFVVLSGHVLKRATTVGMLLAQTHRVLIGLAYGCQHYLSRWIFDLALAALSYCYFEFRRHTFAVTASTTSAGTYFPFLT